MSSDELTFPNTDETMPPKKVEHRKSNAQEGESSAIADSGYRPRSRKLPQHVIVKAPSLLPMMYKPSELAEDLGIPERTLRDWLDAGAPHERDNRNHIWIYGRDFADWVDSQRKKRASGRKLANNEAYCLRCKRVVAFEDPKVRHVKGKLISIQGICPNCSATIYRGGRSE